MTSILFIFSGAPHTSLNAQEGLDALLMGSAFADCRLLFLGQGVLQLLNHQEAEGIGRKNYPLGFAALADYGVTRIACAGSDLETWGLSPEQLCLDVQVLNAEDYRAWLNEADRVLTFR